VLKRKEVSEEKDEKTRREKGFGTGE